VPRRGTHAPVRAPHGEHAAAGQKSLELGHSPDCRQAHRLAPVSAQTTARGTPKGSRLTLGSSRRVPRAPSTLHPHDSGLQETARLMTHDSAADCAKAVPFVQF